MGLFTVDVQMLLALRDAVGDGSGFGAVGTLGRQWLLADPRDVAKLLRRSKLNATAVDDYLRTSHEYADDLFRLLGASSVDAVDYSDYEGAPIVHDLNTPISSDLAGRFQLLFDGGTLEHVFNFPVSIANCMRMVCVGGWLVIHTPANNQCGHGFYQFSPELFYRVLSPENGFKVGGMFFIEGFRDVGERGPFYSVPDPREMRRRVQLDGGYPVSLLIIAQKTTDIIPFQSFPLQSDYTAMWTAGTAPSGKGKRTSFPKRILYALDRSVPRLTQLARNIRNPLRNRHFYQASKELGITTFNSCDEQG